VNLFKELGA
jgi:hypothetical protein